MQTEKWIEIDGFNGKYFISDIGRVKSIWGRKERIMIQHLSKMGNYPAG